MLALSAAGAADLPKATQKAMADLKLDPALLNGLDAELNVPKAWLDGAKESFKVCFRLLLSEQHDAYRQRHFGVNDILGEELFCEVCRDEGVVLWFA